MLFACSFRIFRRIPLSGNFNLCKRPVQVMQLRGRQHDIRRTQVFFQTFHFPGTGNGHYPRFSGQYPGKGNLRRSHAFRRRDLFDQLHQCLVGIEILLSEAGKDGAEVGRVEV